jgi:Zn-dependent protease with chaperone function
MQFISLYHSKLYKQFFVVVFSVFIPFHTTFGQKTNNPLNEISEIDISQEFLTVREMLKAQSKNNNTLSIEENLEIQKTILNTSYAISSINKSGYIIFTGELVDYLNKIKDYLLRDYEFFRTKIRIYISKDPNHNAFSIINGNIYLNVGLIANVENEAQLAFIICHEIMHIVNEHTIKEQLNNRGFRDVLNGTEVIKGNGNSISKTHSVSQLNEFQADNDGLKLFSLSKYSLFEALKAIELLNSYEDLNSNIEITNQLFFLKNSDILDTFSVSYEKPKKYDSHEFNLEEFEINTHPSIKERFDKINTLISVHNDTNNNSIYLLTDLNEFNKYQKFAKYEVLSCLISSEELVPALIYSLNLVKNGDNSIEVINNICYILTKFYKLKKLNNKIISLSNNAKEQKISDYLNSLSTNEFKIYIISVLNELSSINTQSNPLINKYLDFINFTNFELKENSIQNIDFMVNIYENDFNIIKQYKYVKSEKFETISGKIVAANFQNLNINANKKEINILYSEKIDNQVTAALVKLSESNENLMYSPLPNKKKYTTDAYIDYQLVNNWVNERINETSSKYLSYYSLEIDSFIRKTGVKYVMVGLNVEVNALSGNLFANFFLSSIPAPILIPQTAFKFFTNKKRKYMLTLLFNLETQELVGWDRRTYLEPNSIAQLYQNYNNILYEFKKK